MNVRLRVGSIVALVAIFGYLTAANFLPKQVRMDSPLLPDDGLRWGLDLQGGIHWVVGVELDEATTRELEFVRGNLKEAFEDDGRSARALVVEGGRLIAELRSERDAEKFLELATDYGVLRSVAEDGLRLEYELTASWLQEIRERTMLQVLEVLRRRIDDPIRGIPDSVVTRQGDDRVLVQIPGGQIDRARARALLGSTGFLEFKLVVEAAESEALLRSRFPDGLPEGMEIVPEIDKETNRVLQVYLLPEKPELTGNYLEDARVGFDRQQRPIVNFTFNPEGGELFGQLTESHLKEQLAIVLDGRVYSAPVIQGRISMRGQISGRFSSQEAADLAVVLRAGALSVPVVIEEERTVGPTLGQDSIDSGLQASLVGLIAIVAFVVGYYRLSGGYASLALAVNLVLLMGLMSLFEATLTLPGIAGLVLTVGMAVDANVIIFERIREELRTGKAIRAAIATGFQKALWTVLDANIT
ncbi:MAG: protein translocase subunit SecD, partial [Proteobacteria bacterium]|nr:protein translocase subunit SecD [Pseudomonadota bacterium]